MTTKKGKEPSLLGMAFDEALARLTRVTPRDLEASFEEARKDDEEAQKYAEERRTSIRKGARRTGSRYRF